MQRGFTLIEIIIVSAIGAMLVLASIPFFQSFSGSHQLDVNSEDLLNALRRAQSSAMVVRDNSRFGVYFTAGAGGSFIFYGGDSYLTRDPGYDEIYNLPGTISLSFNLGGASEINFGKLKGIPSAAGTIALTNTNGEIRILSVNEVGRINIQ